MWLAASLRRENCMFISAWAHYACGYTDTARNSCLEPNDLTRDSLLPWHQTWAVFISRLCYPSYWLIAQLHSLFCYINFQLRVFQGDNTFTLKLLSLGSSKNILPILSQIEHVVIWKPRVLTCLQLAVEATEVEKTWPVDYLWSKDGVQECSSFFFNCFHLQFSGS